MTFALVGARIFDGAQMLDGHAVIVEGARIRGLQREADLPGAVDPIRIEGLLAPGFIDVQVNGGGGVLFNDRPDVDAIRAIGEAHRRFGTTGFLPTLITDRRERMAEAVAAVRKSREAGVPGVLGIHLEGPFLNPERKGVHDPALMRPIEDADLAIMTSLQNGVTLVTLAPEMVPPGTISRLAGSGIIVSAGHTNADPATVQDAVQRGLRGFTHLFNAMPPLAGREPGVVGAALDNPDTWCGLIVDGHHVDDASLRVAIAAKGAEHMMLVTDAMSTVGTELASFELFGKTVHRENGRLATSDGTLAGSDLDMAGGVRNAVHRLGIALPDALRMASLNPAAFLRLDHERGRIAPGHRADLVLLDDDMCVKETWIDGRTA